MTRTILITSLIFLGSSCATGPFPIESPYYQIPAGSRITLNQVLKIPANSARVYLQHGKIVNEKEKDRYQAHCWFLSWKVLEIAQTIEPDTFIVVRSQKNEDIVQNLNQLNLASNSIGMEIGFGPGLGVAKKASRSTEMHLWRLST